MQCIIGNYFIHLRGESEYTACSAGGSGKRRKGRLMKRRECFCVQSIRGAAPEHCDVKMHHSPRLSKP